MGGPIKRDRVWFFGAFRSGDNQQLQQGNYYNKRQGSLFYEPDLEPAGPHRPVVQGPHPAPHRADRAEAQDRRRDLDAAELQLFLQPAEPDRRRAVGARGQRAASLQPAGQHELLVEISGDRSPAVRNDLRVPDREPADEAAGHHRPRPHGHRRRHELPVRIARAESRHHRLVHLRAALAVAARFHDVVHHAANTCSRPGSSCATSPPAMRAGTSIRTRSTRGATTRSGTAYRPTSVSGPSRTRGKRTAVTSRSSCRISGRSRRRR